MDRWLAWLQLRQQPPIPFPELSVFTCALSRIAGLTYRLKIGLIVATASGDRLDVVNPRILCLSSAPAAHTQPALSSDDVPPQLRGKYDTFRGPRSLSTSEQLCISSVGLRSRSLRITSSLPAPLRSSSVSMSSVLSRAADCFLLETRQW